METNKRFSRETEYAMMSAAAAGIVSSILLAVFLEIFTWLFVPSVMIAVFLSAYLAFRRQMRSKGALNRSRIVRLATEVGLVSHFYTFVLYFPLDYFINDSREFDVGIIWVFLVSLSIFSIVSIIFFSWIAVPMYIGVGYIQKSIEKKKYNEDEFTEEAILASMRDEDA